MDWLLKTVQPRKISRSDIFSIVLEKLSPQEHVKLATFVDAVTHQAFQSSDQSQDQSVILAVVCNVDDEFEQGALLLVSCASQPATILAVLPIVSGIDISISEASSSTTAVDHLSLLGDESKQDAPKASDDLE